jgi:hypothetical protein
VKLADLDQDTRTRLKKLTRGACTHVGFILKRISDPDVTQSEIRRLVKAAELELGERA